MATNHLTKQEYSKIIDLSSDTDKTFTRRYTVKIDFTNLTDDQIAEWAVKPIIINWQNTNRKKSTQDWAPEGNIILKATPTGTKSISITRTQALQAMLGEKFDSMVAKFGTVDKLYEAVKQFIDTPIETETEEETE